ncbi:MAG: hypothetical protein FWE06_05870 [Oscillospiraceae bacterium]|nr:hypothetical protein [Oscillospiraceae bacterium]
MAETYDVERVTPLTHFDEIDQENTSETTIRFNEKRSGVVMLAGIYLVE